MTSRLATALLPVLAASLLTLAVPPAVPPAGAAHRGGAAPAQHRAAGHRGDLLTSEVAARLDRTQVAARLEAGGFLSLIHI